MRATKVPNLELLDFDELYSTMDEQAFMKFSTISFPDIKVHLYDFSYLGDRKARRMIYSGTENGKKMGYLVHQTVNGNKIITFACGTYQEYFTPIYNELDEIVDSFRFVK